MAEVEQSRIKLQALEVQLSHDRAMYAIKTDFLRDLIHSLIDRRVDAVERGLPLWPPRMLQRNDPG